MIHVSKIANYKIPIVFKFWNTYDWHRTHDLPPRGPFAELWLKSEWTKHQLGFNDVLPNLAEGQGPEASFLYHPELASGFASSQSRKWTVFADTGASSGNLWHTGDGQVVLPCGDVLGVHHSQQHPPTVLGTCADPQRYRDLQSLH